MIIQRTNEMNTLLIFIGTAYVIFSAYMTFKVKHISVLSLSVPLLLMAYMTFGSIKIGESIQHQEPFKAFNDNGTLVVLDSNKNSYVDTSYVGGKICIDVKSTQHVSRLFSGEASRTLNTKCQND
jgi:hypothetical protein